MVRLNNEVPSSAASKLAMSRTEAMNPFDASSLGT
jgi:hypothetical protein